MTIDERKHALREKIKLLRGDLAREWRPVRRAHIEYMIRACEVELEELEAGE